MKSPPRTARLQIPEGFAMPAPRPLPLGVHPEYGELRGRIRAPSGKQTSWRFVVELQETHRWTNPEPPHETYPWGYVGFALNPATGAIGAIEYLPYYGYRGPRQPKGQRRERRTVPLALRQDIRRTLGAWLATYADQITGAASLGRIAEAVAVFTSARGRVENVRQMLEDAEARVAEQAAIVERQTEAWQPPRAVIEGLNVSGRIVPGSRPTEVTVEVERFVVERRTFPRGRFSYTRATDGHWHSTTTNLSRYAHERLTSRTFKMVHRVVDPAMDAFLSQQLPLGVPPILAVGGTAALLEGTRREVARWREDLRRLEAKLADPLLVTEDAILQMLRSDHAGTRELAITTLGALATQLEEREPAPDAPAVAAPATGATGAQMSLPL